MCACVCVRDSKANLQTGTERMWKANMKQILLHVGQGAGVEGANHTQETFLYMSNMSDTV